MRGNSSGAMPTPVSLTRTTMAPPDTSLVTRTTWLSTGAESFFASIACEALMSRFTKTCPSVAKAPGARGTSERATSSLARLRSSDDVSVRAVRRTRFTSMGILDVPSDMRVKSFSSPTMSAIRPEASPSSCAISRSRSSAPDAGSRRESSRRPTCAAARTRNATGLLISCAIPAASAPSDARRSACMSALRDSSSVVTSYAMSSTAFTRPSASNTG
jgi:hypothetical protein